MEIYIYDKEACKGISAGIAIVNRLLDVNEMNIYVRERTKVGEGVRQPQFKVVATSGDGTAKISFRAKHLRRSELEQIAEDTGAALVYLKSARGSGAGGNKE